MSKHPTEASSDDMDVARGAWEATALLIDRMLVSAAREDSGFIERLEGAFATGGISLRVTMDFHGDGRVSQIRLSSVDRKGQTKTVSVAEFKAAPEGKDTLQ